MDPTMLRGAGAPANGAGAPANGDTLVELFRKQMEAHEHQTHELATVKLTLASTQDQLAKITADNDASTARAKQAEELCASLQESLEKYASACTLHDAATPHAAGGGGTPPQDGEQAARRRLEVQLEQQAAECVAMKAHVEQLQRDGATVAALQAELETERAAKRRAVQQCEQQQQQLAEHQRKHREMRDRLGRAEMDRQRDNTAHQQQLSSAAMKLRSCKGQNEQLQRKLNDSQRRPGGSMFQQGAGGVFGGATTFA